MGNFRSDNREDRGYGRSGGYSGGRSGGFNRTGFRSRDAGRRPLEMHKVICSKCKKECEVPFKPTGDKPVYCSDCFKTEGGSSPRFGSRGSSSGISQEQYKELNTKLDKILSILKKADIEEVEDK